MSIARGQFKLAHKAIVDALIESVVLDNGVGSTPHNERARLLRNGLAVMIFSSLEGFIRDRMIEILKEIDGNLVPFSSLPEGIQKIIAVGPIEGINNKIRYLKPIDAISVIRAEAMYLGSLDKESAYGISNFSFGKDRSNLSVDDLKAALSSLGVVGDPWENMKRISAMANLGGLVSPQTQFKALSTERNGAAHNSAHQVAVSSLGEHAQNCLALAISFDILATTAKNILNARTPISGVQHSYLRIGMLIISPRPTPRKPFSLNRLGVSKAIKLESNVSALQKLAVSKMSTTDAVLEFDNSNTPISWHV